MARTANERLQSAWLRYRHALERLSAGEAKKLIEYLERAEREIAVLLAEQAELWERAREVGDAKTADQAREERRRLRRLEEQIDDVLDAVVVDQERALRSSLLDAAQVEADRAMDAIIDELGRVSRALVASFNRLPLEALARIVQEPLGGMTWNQRLRNYSKQEQAIIRQALSESLMLGESIAQAQRRLSDSVWPESRYRRELLARTELLRVSNEVNERLYDENDDVIRGVQAVATLDTRTCLRCAVLDRIVYMTEEKEKYAKRPRYPLHPQCRCIYAPVLRGLEELGIDPSTVPPGTRAAMRGDIPETFGYDEWLRRELEEEGPDAEGPRGQPSIREMLGDERYELWQSGKIRLDQMATESRILSVAELRRRFVRS